jgi:outer membrane protein
MRISSLLLFLTLGLALNAQKVGYIDTKTIISELPEVKEANTTIETLKAQLLKKGQDMVKTLQTKYQKLQSQQNDISPIKYEEEAATLKKEEEAIIAFEKESQQKISAKSEELLGPIQTKINTAITSVAKEEGYAYVFDLAAGQILYADASTDLSAKIKAKFFALK